MEKISYDELLTSLATLKEEPGTVFSLNKIYEHSDLKKFYTLDSVQSAFQDLLDLNYVDGEKYMQLPDDWSFKRLTAYGKQYLSNADSH